MIRKSIRYAFVFFIVYVIVVGYLGFFVRDDFFTLTFPSWPFLINCFEDCGYKIFIALFANGILVWVLSFIVISIMVSIYMFLKELVTQKGNIHAKTK